MGMSLSEAVKVGPPKPRQSNWCKVGVWLNSLDATDQQNARTILDSNSGWTHPAVTELLKANGCEGLGKASVGEHRRGACACEPR